MPSTSPRVGLSYSVSTDTPDVPRDIKAVTDALDVTLGAPSFTSTTRPTTGNYVGRLIYETDTQNVMRFDGTNWVFLNPVVNPPRCCVYQATGSTLTSGTAMDLPFDGEVYDTDNMHSTTTNNARITATTAGLYSLKGQCNFGSGATGTRQVAFYKNGGAQAYSSTNALSSGSTVVQVTKDVYLAAGDYVTLNVLQGQGANITLVTGQQYTFFSARWVASS